VLRKSLFIAVAALLTALASTSEAKAWGCYHYSYHTNAYGGTSYHYGYHSGGVPNYGYHYGGYGGYHYGYARRW
jgi:hypothetical protein